MAQNFGELLKKMSPEAHHDIDASVASTRGAMISFEEARKLTRAEVSRTLGLDAAELERLEEHIDVYVQLLRANVEDAGGKLEICARYPGGETLVELSDR